MSGKGFLCMNVKLAELSSAAIEISALLKNPDLKKYQRDAYLLALDLINREISRTIIADY